MNIIVPVFNEEENIPLLIERFSSVLSECISYEILFVDDGSTDKTLANIKQACQSTENIYYVSLSKNFGHQNALKAGIDSCNGDIILFIDGDLQHPPEMIPKMLHFWREGYDIVYTCRKDNQAIGIFKKISAHVFYRGINLISKLHIKPGAADFRLIDKQVLVTLRDYNEHDLFFRGIIASIGYRQIEIEYTPAKRAHGITKYSFRKMVSLALSGITSFSVFPLRALAIAGFFFSFTSFLYGLYALGVKFFSNHAVPGWTSIMAGIYFLGGLQLAAMGICGEYIGKIFLEVKRRPHYIISESRLPDHGCTQKDIQ
ncbi:MAG: glycosyltransferase family 2 protein [Desulfobacterales bacterium]|nr:glycosyltransferase family 2 protein [Desulfobacterales bacterium]